MQFSSGQGENKRYKRIWMDGCFDMMHFGHANALRQAKMMWGDYLVVGVHSDKEIEKNKGPPVMTEEERYQAVAACKWVDEVVPDAPYTTQLELMDKYSCEICVHGDDLVVGADGVDTYHLVKAAGRFRTIPRTVGVSTTDLVGRMLLLTRDHLAPAADKSVESAPVKEYARGATSTSPYTRLTKFVATTKKIMDFSGEKREPKPGEKVVYIDGGWDLFHIGHIRILEFAKKQGDFLIVGLYDDRTVNDIKGSNFPIMNIYERVLGVLSCRYVDEVVIGAPYVPSEEFLQSLNISVLVNGTVHDGTVRPHVDTYAAAKHRELFREVPSPSALTTAGIIDRILRNRQKYEERNRKKEAKELANVQQQQQQK